MAVVIWLAAAFLLGVIEACTTALVSVWLALGAVAAAIAAGFGIETIGQTVVFLVVSLILLLCTAPICKHFRQTQKIPTNADMLIGKIGVIIEDTDPILRKGEVKVCGQTWSVQVRGGKNIKVGTKVKVEDIVGAHLVVSEINSAELRESEDN